ncbi:MAG: hypothetical protein ACLFNS_11945, partial [Desulfobacterales bacterium]
EYDYEHEYRPACAGLSTISFLEADCGTAKKKVQDPGAQIPRNPEYLLLSEIPGNAAQQRYWTFCEAVK